MSGRATHLFERAAAHLPPLPEPLVAEPLVAEPLPDPGPDPGPPPGTAPGHEAAGGAGGSAVVSLDTLAAAGFAMSEAQRSRLAEEWRIAANSLLRRLRAAQPTAAHPPNLLMVTSARPEEGKSFSALNLAGRLAQDRMAEVLLIDLDTKQGGLTDVLGLSEQPGAFDLLDQAMAGGGAGANERLIHPTAIGALSIMPVGQRRGESGRSVTRPLIAAIEAEARRLPNRVVVLDTAPCLATSDAAGLAPSVSQIAFIVEADRTQRPDLETALEMLRPCDEIVLVLNKMRAAADNAFSGYHSYYG